MNLTGKWILKYEKTITELPRSPALPGSPGSPTLP